MILISFVTNIYTRVRRNRLRKRALKTSLKGFEKNVVTIFSEQFHRVAEVTVELFYILFHFPHL